MQYLADTNVILRFVNRHDPLHPIIRGAVRKLRADSHHVCIVPQNCVEFWNVATRPAARNGYGLSITDTNTALRLLERLFPLLQKNRQKACRFSGGSVTARGFTFMDSPGYDPVSGMGQVAGGCNLVLFTTGRGSVFGFKPAPTIKISTNSATYEQMLDDMDLNAGRSWKARR